MEKTRHGERNGGDIVSFRFRLLSVVNIHRTFSISCRASNHDFLKQFLLRSTRKLNLCKTSNDYDSFSIVIYLLLDVDLASDSYRINKCRIKFFHFQIKQIQKIFKCNKNLTFFFFIKYKNIDGAIDKWLCVKISKKCRIKFYRFNPFFKKMCTIKEN